MMPDGLDDEVWPRLADIMIAANRGDPDTMLKLVRSYDAATSHDQQLAGAAYAAYVLRYRVIEPLRRMPTAEEIVELAARIYPKYSRVIREPVSSLEDALRAVFTMPRPNGTQVAPSARLFICVTAAAGVLLKDPPAADLASMRPRVARWNARDAGQPER